MSINLYRRKPLKGAKSTGKFGRRPESENKWLFTQFWYYTRWSFFHFIFKCLTTMGTKTKHIFSVKKQNNKGSIKTGKRYTGCNSKGWYSFFLILIQTTPKMQNFLTAFFK